MEEQYESFDYKGAEHSVPEECSSALQGRNNTPLYTGAELSNVLSHLLVLHYALRHSLTKKAFTELLFVHLPRGATIAKSVYSLKRFFVECFPESQALQHYYCECCQRSLPSSGSTCAGDGCGHEGCPAVYITVPIAPQIKQMMEGELAFTKLYPIM